MPPSADARAAHLSPPLLEGRLPRPRLLDLLDGLPSTAPVRYLLAPAGGGKSVLMAQWLQRQAGRPGLWLRLDRSDADPATAAQHLHEALSLYTGKTTPPDRPGLTREHLADPGTLLRRCARTLFAAVPANAALVLDDLHTVPDAAALIQALPALADELHPGQTLWLLSRHEPPHGLALAQACGQLVLIDGPRLAFDVDDTRAWLQQQGLQHDAAALHAATAGWPLLTPLLATQRQAPGTTDVSVLLDQVVWSTLDADSLALLERLAWLPPVGAEVLGEHAPALLQRLQRRGLPIETLGNPQAPQWRLHDLLRDDARRRQCNGPASVRIDRLVTEARCLLVHGDADHADVARALLTEAATSGPAVWPMVVQVLEGLTPQWLASQQLARLRDAVQAVPEAQRSASLWWALAQAELPRNPASARALADRATALATPDRIDLQRACQALAIATHFQSFDDTRPLASRVAALQALGVPDPVPPFLAVAVWSALFLREPAHPQTDAWRERVWALLHQTGADPNLRLRAAMLMAKEGWYNGHHAELTQLPALVQEALGQPAVTPYGRLLWGLMRQYAAWSAADWAVGLQATEDALADGQSSGIALLDQHLRLHGACFASLTGDDAQADRWLAAVADRADPARRMEAWHHFSVRGWLALRRGQWAQADAAARIAVEAAQAMGPAPLAMALAVSAHARAALADGASLQPTRDALAAVVAVSPRNALARLHLGLLDARMAQTLGDVDAALRALRQTLPLVRAHGLEAPFGIDPEALSSLLLLSLNHGGEPSAATALASAMRLRAPAGAGAVWPYPVRVRTNNHVEIELQGRPLRPVGKAQRRPIELLQALIEQGGQATATTLADRLWPDADGDQAMASFEVALRRLRQLVSCPAALVLNGGVLALDRRLVWVDVLDAPVGIPHSSAIRRPSVGWLELGAS